MLLHLNVLALLVDNGIEEWINFQQPGYAVIGKVDFFLFCYCVSNALQHTPLVETQTAAKIEATLPTTAE